MFAVLKLKEIRLKRIDDVYSRGSYGQKDLFSAMSLET